ncbi:MAG: hypothetical protein CBC93_06085 [Gammaproteobacteria bacterium TMED133]|nr:MAG: hypothetical protein CBC93_06085 [Gammaproteobacteria bacterium TMED133]
MIFGFQAIVLGRCVPWQSRIQDPSLPMHLEKLKRTAILFNFKYPETDNFTLIQRTIKPYIKFHE